MVILPIPWRSLSYIHADHAPFVVVLSFIVRVDIHLCFEVFASTVYVSSKFLDLDRVIEICIFYLDRDVIWSNFPLIIKF